MVLPGANSVSDSHQNQCFRGITPWFLDSTSFPLLIVLQIKGDTLTLCLILIPILEMGKLEAQRRTFA